jgi:hypothetical protein
MDVNKLKVGDILIAIDECIMNDTEFQALIIGKEYEIQRIDTDLKLIEIISEYSKIKKSHTYHGFRFRDINKFFKLKK